ncbi:hypothetical protein KC19_9G001400 [Ceratodon purpureus]|nr:hypothetical protein KC19_9G001400 [Ceratodon purpureus]
MATDVDIMCKPSKKETSPERADKRPAVSASSEESKLNVMPVPSSSKQKWWRPDPVTGTWVPEGYEGQVTTSTDMMKSPSRITRIRSETSASLEDKRWWTSMEELPDMDRANPK